MPICRLKDFLVAVIVLPALTGHQEIHSLSSVNVSGYGQNPKSSFCAKMHFKAQLKLIGGFSSLS